MIAALLRALLAWWEGAAPPGPLGLVGQPAGASVIATGTIVAPTGGATLATIPAASLPAGLWHLAVWVGYGATAGLDDDFRVVVGSTNLSAMRIPALANTGLQYAWETVQSLDGATQLRAQAVVGGVAGSVYKAYMIATPIRS